MIDALKTMAYSILQKVLCCSNLNTEGRQQNCEHDFARYKNVLSTTYALDYNRQLNFAPSFTVNS